jgi:hypothetical protein
MIRSFNGAFFTVLVSPLVQSVMAPTTTTQVVRDTPLSIQVPYPWQAMKLAPMALHAPYQSKIGVGWYLGGYGNPVRTILSPHVYTLFERLICYACAWVR